MATIARCQQRGWKRKLVPRENAEAPELTEYEKERFERIKRNRQVLDELEVVEASNQLQQLTNKPKTKQRPKQKLAVELPVVPSRRSSRIAGHAADSVVAEAAAAIDSDKPVASSLLTQQEYFTLIGKQLAPQLESDGRFKGWVSPDVCKMYGIASSAAEAWEAEGGGTFSRRPDMTAVPAHLRAKGWSGAKAFAATMLRKNPNTYFYRHVAPHEQQAQGEWTAEEQQLFLKTAKEHGVGDKWGLFASHIPQRVGYQCSAYHRDVMVAQGLILDKRFRMTPSGHAVFVGEDAV